MRADLVDIRRAAELVHVGILPAAGGWADQSATFADAAFVLFGEKARYDQERAHKPKGRE